MASVSDLVKYYQHSIEKHATDEQKVLKCIDKLFKLDVTVQHLQDTGVGRTVNALRKEPGDVGQAARALVYKWKLMVAAEESDQEEHNESTGNNEYEYNAGAKKIEKNVEKSEHSYKRSENSDNSNKRENGDYSGHKRKLPSSEEEEPNIKKYKHNKENGYKKIQMKQEPESNSENDSPDDSSSSESESSCSQTQSSEEESEEKIKVEKDIKAEHINKEKYSPYCDKEQPNKKISDYSRKYSRHTSEISSDKEKTFNRISPINEIKKEKREKDYRSSEKENRTSRKECSSTDKEIRSTGKEVHEVEKEHRLSQKEHRSSSKEYRSSHKEHKSSQKEHKSSIKDPKSLHKENKPSEKEHHSSGKEHRSSEKEYRSSDKEHRSTEKDHRSTDKEHKSSNKESRSSQKQHRLTEKECKSSEKERKSSEQEQKSIEKKHKLPDKERKSLLDEYKSPDKIKELQSKCDKEKSSSSSHKHKDSNKYKSSEVDKHLATEKSSSKVEKPKSSKNDKYKTSSDKEAFNNKNKLKDSKPESKERFRSPSNEKIKDKNTSSKDKEHRSDKKHSSSIESDSRGHHSKRSNNNDEKSSKKNKNSSNKRSSNMLKEEVLKKSEAIGDSDDGIDCGSGASFAEALGMALPSKSKKKQSISNTTPPKNPISDDLSPASLLSPSAKLAPLPPMEISALPEISPNYRPRPPPKFMPHFNDDDAMSAVISSKNQRTKVYSGNKIHGKIPTLYEMCVHILQEHIDALEFTGGVPYDILKPVIDKATPQQLFMLEHYNPYLMEDTDHLWQKFCDKSFRSKKRQELETWREMFMRCQEEQEMKLKSLTANIRIAQEAKKAPIKQTKMAYVDSVVKPPRNIAKKQAQHGTAFAATASPAARVASLASTPNVLKNGRPTPVSTATSSSFKPKKAPLMQKALQFMRGRKR